MANKFDYGMGAAAIEYDGEHKYIRITDIDENTHKYIGTTPVSPSGEIDPQYIVQSDDILFARTGASVGKTYLYDESDGLLYFAGFLIRANVNNENNSHFVYSQTLTERYKKWVLATSMRSGQPGINSQEYGTFKFFAPTKKEQDKIAEFLKLLDKKIEKQSNLIDCLKLYKRGVLSRLFDEEAPHTTSWKKCKIGDFLTSRVSTDKDEQFTSYEAQVDYYTKFIKANAEWEFIKVYTDEGITGTNTKKRDGFKQMIEDALNGKIDLIVTKSVSRFARNTVDSLVTIRELKAKGVEVYFEKENIWTLDSKGELLLTIMSSLAQEESRSISENVTWGKRKSAADGKISFGYKQFLGYDKGENGTLVVNQEQAVIVKRIYREFMQGKTPWMIAHTLSQDSVPTPSGKSTTWRASVIESILTNEKYKGSALLQKKFTVDYLTKKMKTNEGEVPQYYVDDSHEAIIPPDEWEKVQKEFVRRKAMGRKYSGNSVFATKIVCGDCGAFFGSKVWNSTSEKYRRTIWQCNDKFKGDKKCGTPHITEDEIKAAFVKAFNNLFTEMDEIIENCRSIADNLTDCTTIDNQISELEQELEVIT